MTFGKGKITTYISVPNPLISSANPLPRENLGGKKGGSIEGKKEVKRRDCFSSNLLPCPSQANRVKEKKGRPLEKRKKKRGKEKGGDWMEQRLGPVMSSFFLIVRQRERRKKRKEKGWEEEKKWFPCPPYRVPPA